MASLTKRLRHIDTHIGRRIRARRIELALTQAMLADAIGLTYQQVHKYEVATNRVSASALLGIANVLGTAPAYFYEGLVEAVEPPPPPLHQRMAATLVQRFHLMDYGKQVALCNLVAEFVP